MTFLGNPQFGCELQPIDFARAAEAMGGRGFAVDQAHDVAIVLDEAFAADGPVVIEATVDSYQLMLPPKMPPDYAENLRKALPERPNNERIEENLAREPASKMPHPA